MIELDNDSLIHAYQAMISEATGILKFGGINTTQSGLLIVVAVGIMTKFVPYKQISCGGPWC